MTNVYIYSINNCFINKKLIIDFPIERVNRIETAIFEEKKAQLFYSTLLLKYVLSMNNLKLNNVTKNGHLIYKYNNICYSIAHKDKYVLLAINTNNNSVGIDLENQNKNIENSLKLIYPTLTFRNPLMSWCSNEAYYKCSGSKAPLNIFSNIVKGQKTEINGENYYFHFPRNIKGYLICLCQKNKSSYKFMEVDYGKLSTL